METSLIVSLVAIGMAAVTLFMKLFSSFDRALSNSVAHVKEDVSEQAVDIENLQSENKIQGSLGVNNSQKIAVLENEMQNKNKLLEKISDKLDKLIDRF